MIEKPNISDEKISISLHENYSIQVNEIEFLPIGNDPSAFAYRVEADNGSWYFVKLKKTLSNLAGFYVPRFLKDNGIEQVVAPFVTNRQELWTSIDEFSLILYPYIKGVDAMKAGMSASQWVEFGSTLKQVHYSKPPSSISQYVRSETFIPPWGETVKELHTHVNELSFDDPFQKDLAAFWKENNATIQAIVERTEAIGKRLKSANLEFVLCHADIHTANILLTPEQTMFIVDWDDTLLAPKERDLMFVLNEDPTRGREEELFFHGYGETEMNQLVLAYYRYEWCVQEIGDFGTRVFLTKDTGNNTKQNALEGFRTLFLRGDVVDSALHTSVEYG